MTSEEVSVEGFLYSWMAAKKAMGAEIDFSVLEKLRLTGIWRKIFIVWLDVLCVTAPFAAGGIVITTITKINKLFRRKTIKKEKVYIFTENNERTRIAAKTIYEENREAFFIFICTDEKIEENIPHKCFMSLSELHFDSLKVKEIELQDFSFDKKVRTTEIISFYEALKTQQLEKRAAFKVILKIFNADNVSKKRYQDIFDNENDRNSFFITDIYEKLAVDVLTKYPLYDPNGEAASAEDDRTEMNVLLIGCGKFGKAFIKKLFSLGHFLNSRSEPVKLRLTVVDSSAANIKDKLMMKCSAFVNTMEKGGYLRFLEYDAEKCSFRQLIKDKHFDYCVISTGDDELNIDIQKCMQCEFIRDKIKRRELNKTASLFEGLPFIALRICDKEKAEAYQKVLNDSSDNHSNIKVFGTDHEMFSFKHEDALNKISLALYNINNMNYAGSTFDTPEQIKELFLRNEDKLKSNFNKIFDVVNSQEEALFLKKYLLRNVKSDSRSEKEFNNLISLIHNRWYVSMLYDGFEYPDDEAYDEYKSYNKEHHRSLHKFMDAKYNRLLVPFEQLGSENISACDIVKVKMLNYIADEPEIFIGKEK